jgi:hypothetical protein
MILETIIGATAVGVSLGAWAGYKMGDHDNKLGDKLGMSFLVGSVGGMVLGGAALVSSHILFYHENKIESAIQDLHTTSKIIHNEIKLGNYVNAKNKINSFKPDLSLDLLISKKYDSKYDELSQELSEIVIDKDLYSQDSMRINLKKEIANLKKPNISCRADLNSYKSKIENTKKSLNDLSTKVISDSIDNKQIIDFKELKEYENQLNPFNTILSQYENKDTLKEITLKSEGNRMHQLSNMYVDIYGKDSEIISNQITDFVKIVNADLTKAHKSSIEETLQKDYQNLVRVQFMLNEYKNSNASIPTIIRNDLSKTMSTYLNNGVEKIEEQMGIKKGEFAQIKDDFVFEQQANLYICDNLEGSYIKNHTTHDRDPISYSQLVKEEFYVNSKGNVTDESNIFIRKDLTHAGTTLGNSTWKNQFSETINDINKMLKENYK